MKKRVPTAVIWIGAICVFILLFGLNQTKRLLPEETYKVFSEQAELGQLSRVKVDGDELIATVAETGQRYRVKGELTSALIEALESHGADIQYGLKLKYGDLLTSWLPIIIIIALCIIFIRRTGGARNNWYALRRSPVREAADQDRTTFAEVGGLAEAKILLGDVIDYLRDPKRWEESGARVPPGSASRRASKMRQDSPRPRRGRRNEGKLFLPLSLRVRRNVRRRRRLESTGYVRASSKEISLSNFHR